MEFRPDLIIPELYQLLLIGVLFIQTIADRPWMPRVGKWIPWFAGMGILISAASLNLNGLIFAGSYRVDTLSQFFKFAVSFGFAVAVLNATRQPTLEKEKHSEYFMFMALSAWG